MHSFAIGTFYCIQGHSSWGPHSACIFQVAMTLVCASVDAMEYVLLSLSHRDVTTFTCNKWYEKHGEGDSWPLFLYFQWNLQHSTTWLHATIR